MVPSPQVEPGSVDFIKSTIEKAPLAFTNGALKFFGWSAFSSLHRGPCLYPRERLARGQDGQWGYGMVSRTRS